MVIMQMLTRVMELLIGQDILERCNQIPNWEAGTGDRHSGGVARRFRENSGNVR